MNKSISIFISSVLFDVRWNIHLYGFPLNSEFMSSSWNNYGLNMRWLFIIVEFQIFWHSTIIWMSEKNMPEGF